MLQDEQLVPWDVRCRTWTTTCLICDREKLWRSAATVDRDSFDSKKLEKRLGSSCLDLIRIMGSPLLDSEKHDVSNKISLSTIFSRIPPQSQLPEELLLTILMPLITPHKESRDHHLLLTSHKTGPTAQLIHDVSFSRYASNVLASFQCSRSKDDCDFC